jgi:hypothetical protein
MTMRNALVLFPIALAAAAIVGCSGSGSPTQKATPTPAAVTADTNAEVREALDKLSPDDRKLAAEQKTCPITNEPLGSMGVPPKVTLKDQTVFLCCPSCKKKAEADLDKTLKAVADAKAKSGGK